MRKGDVSGFRMELDGATVLLCSFLSSEKKQQVPPLRYAPVGMKILFGDWDVRTQNELSSRPERSEVEGPAVLTNGS
jgi:hypothetical protein